MFFSGMNCNLEIVSSDMPVIARIENIDYTEDIAVCFLVSRSQITLSIQRNYC